MSNALDHYTATDIIEIGFTPISGLDDRCYTQHIGNAKITLDIASDGYMVMSWGVNRLYLVSTLYKPQTITLIAYRSVHTNLWTCGDIDNNTPMSLDDMRLALIKEYHWRVYGI